LKYVKPAKIIKAIKNNFLKANLNPYLKPTSVGAGSIGLFELLT